MTTLDASYQRPRKHYQKIPLSIDLPYLIEVQKKSYEQFLQRDIAPGKRKDVGLQGVFRSVFPVTDFSETVSVEFVEYAFDDPKYSEEQCRQRGMSYEVPLKIVIRLVIWDREKDSTTKTIRDVKEQEVFFGAIPLMTENGTFIINGIERVIVSQLHRSSGVFFDHDRGKGLTSGKFLYSARIIPYRGSWLDFEFDSKDILYVRIDRRRKLHVTILLKALGYTTAELLDLYYDTEEIALKEGAFFRKLNIENMQGQKATQDFVDPKSGKVIVKKNRRITAASVRQLLELGVLEQELDVEEMVGKILARPVLDQHGEELIPSNTELEEDHVDVILESGAKQVHVLSIDGVNVDHTFRNTLLADKILSDEDAREQALIEIYRRIRPGETPTLEPAESLFHSMFFDSSRYDLSVVGRVKLNERLGLDLPIEHRILSREDIVQTVKILLDLKIRMEDGDDIDNLSNRRVRAVGELLENQYRIGVLRVERAIRERLQLADVSTLLPHDFINNKPASAVVKEFFGSSQLSQFMDQTNPLSEVTHKRRLSALGPGGLSRERAGFEVRDVHDTHYGRICPVETPEGPNIGLISSLASYARVNDHGFIETPYLNLSDGSVKYYSAAEEHRGHVIRQAVAPTKPGEEEEYTVARRSWVTETVRLEEADLSDVGAGQLISVAAALIPFLQNNDANRALMGSNMMRQAVPLIKTRAPLIGTGMEKVVARDSGATVVAKRDGVVMSVDAERIVVKTDEDMARVGEVAEVGADVDIYNLKKYRRSNLDTCINQKPIVRVGERVQAQDIIGDGFATEMGELALGQNVTVAFMPWNGYNFEDSILVSERVVKEDLYTSVHIQEMECLSRDTKLGQEEITCDIPNVGEEALKNLDESGVVVIGAEVESGDILVGKITPKGETQLSPEEKLLRAIFGDKAGDVRDTSLRVPSGVKGTVIGAKIFSREGVEPDGRSLAIQKEEADKIRKDDGDRIAIICDSAARQMVKLAAGHKIAEDIVLKGAKAKAYQQKKPTAKSEEVGDEETSKGKAASVVVLKKGSKITEETLEEIGVSAWYQITVADEAVNRSLSKILKSLKSKISGIKLSTNEKLARLLKGDELPPTVIKMVKVYVAIKRKLQVGDKMAGRHGNKGVVSMILPEEDMPYTADGRAVDVVLNPLGVPSRMNVGQILETHLGWAAKNLGHKINHMMETAFSRPNLIKMCKAIWDTDDVRPSVEGFLKTCSDDQLKDFIYKYREGVHLANPVFDGVVEEEIRQALELAGCATDGKVELYDGRTGHKFVHRVTVGVMYVLKLHHLVDEKIHARSIGPYSLVTQQPLGGKAQFGGQRLGEMEVWAMEAYGAANTLQEMLTVKSDDIVGRTHMYESIVKGTNKMAPGLPESFNVLIKELQSLGLDISLIKDLPAGS